MEIDLEEADKTSKPKEINVDKKKERTEKFQNLLNEIVQTKNKEEDVQSKSENIEVMEIDNFLKEISSKKSGDAKIPSNYLPHGWTKKISSSVSSEGKRIQNVKLSSPTGESYSFPFKTWSRQKEDIIKSIIETGMPYQDENVENKSLLKNIVKTVKKEDNLSETKSELKKRSKIRFGPETYDVRLPKGWFRTAGQRKRGLSQGRYDVNIYSPDGEKFRSKVELKAYLKKFPELCQIDDFDFNVFKLGPNVTERNG